jgi:restriction system protein
MFIQWLSATKTMIDDAARNEISGYADLFGAVLDALKELGGSGKLSEVRDYLATKLNLADAALEVTKKNGEQRFMNRVQWARFYLAKTGYIGSSRRGVWSLTDNGRHVIIDDDVKRQIIANVANIIKPKEDVETQPDNVEAAASPDADGDNYRGQMIELLYTMSPGAFERLCQRLLRESGFEQVVVTGRSGDGGIDGNGVLQLNPFVSFRVIFQCKRYRKTVGSPAIRDFRGAMMGRADKGIILTTGTFSQDAVRESVRDGVPPIELVDGNKLVEMFESLEFGLTPKQVFEVDKSFFASFED